MNHAESAYGLWWLVIINSAIFIMFAFSFFKPATARDWRTFSAFSAFIIALFVEMYGFPLTIYLLSGWLQTRFPELDLLSHNSGHLWSTLLGEKGDPHFGILHIASYIFFGLWFLFTVISMERVVPRTTSSPIGSNLTLCAHTSPPIRGFYLDLAGVFIAMANFTDTDYVSNLTLNVQPLGN